MLVFKDLSWLENQTVKETIVFECDLSMFMVTEDPVGGNLTCFLGQRSQRRAS